MDYCSINNNLCLKKYNTQIKQIDRFIKRYGLLIRRISHIGQKVPESKENLKKKL